MTEYREDVPVPATPGTSPTADERIDVDALPPTQYLMLDVLAARWRVGERLWTFPSGLTQVARALDRLGLVAWKSSTVQGTIMVWLTEAGRDAVLDPNYVLPGDRMGVGVGAGGSGGVAVIEPTPGRDRRAFAQGRLVPMVPASEAAARRDAYVEVILQHWLTPTSGCRCGGVSLGHSWPEHLADALLGETKQGAQ